MKYYLRHEYELTVEEAIKNHNYKGGYESVQHVMRDVFPDEPYKIYVVGDCEIPEIYKDEKCEIDGVIYQLIKSGVGECKI